MQILRRHLAILLAALLPAIQGYAATINVPGDQPTIQAGIDAAQNGDVVIVAPGTYLELIDLHGKAITLESDQGAADTIIDGQSLGSVITMDSGEGPNTIVRGFTIRNGFASFGAGIEVAGASPAISGNILLNNSQGGGGAGAGIDVFVASPVIENNEFVGNSCDSQFASGVISMMNGSNPRIFNNVIHDNPCRAINATLPIDAAPVVYNNTIVRNQTGIYVDQFSSSANQIYRNNLIAQNEIGLDAVAGSSSFDAAWTNNLVFGNVTDVSGTADPAGSNGNINADPLLADAAGGDFHFAEGSPAIDAGTAEGLDLPVYDFDGSPRVQDGNADGLAVVDIGAYEGPVQVTNHAPAASNQAVNGVEDTAASITLEGSDPDGDTITYAIVTQPQHGVLSGSEAAWIYTPEANFNGVDSFTFQVSDGQKSSNIGTVSLTIASVNDPPWAYGIAEEIYEDSGANIWLHGTDPDWDALTYTIVTQPRHGTLTGSGDTYFYRPDANYNGTDSFTYSASDGQASSIAAPVDIRIMSVNDAPVAYAGSANTGEDTPVSVVLQADDVEGDPLTFNIVTQPQHGTLTGSGSNRLYTPAANFNGSDSFSFQANDGQAASGIATVSIAVASVNDAPIAIDNAITTTEDTSVNVALQASDVDGDALTFTVVTQPQHGTLSGSGANRVYTPAANFNGADTFSFRASDGQASSNIATVTIQVVSVNNAPVAVADSTSTKRNTPTTVAVLANDTDVDGDTLTIASVSSSAHGTAVISGSAIVYTPARNFTGTDQFGYTISDGQGGTASAIVTAAVARK